jgi:hypothetical protein
MNVLPFHGLALLPIAALLLYSLYRRYRRHVGPQEVTPLRMGLRVLLLCALAVFILALPRSTQLHLGLIAGIVTGAALGLFSLRHTRFETRGAKHYYIPNIYIGLAVSALFALRLIYRFAVLYPQMQQAGGGFHLPNPGDPLAAMGGSKSLLTLAMLGVVIGYYASYYAGVLLQSRRAVAAQPAAEIETDSAV